VCPTCEQDLRDSPRDGNGIKRRSAKVSAWSQNSPEARRRQSAKTAKRDVAQASKLSNTAEHGYGFALSCLRNDSRNVPLVIIGVRLLSLAGSNKS
jgi:hypothetical protein